VFNISQFLQLVVGRLREETRVRRYSKCSRANHSTRTCQIVINMPEEEDSE
jgi:hypothetical protein